MILEVDTFFLFEKKAKLDAKNPKFQEWEALMGHFSKHFQTLTLRKKGFNE